MEGQGVSIMGLPVRLLLVGGGGSCSMGRGEWRQQGRGSGEKEREEGGSAPLWRKGHLSGGSWKVGLSSRVRKHLGSCLVSIPSWLYNLGEVI